MRNIGTRSGPAIRLSRSFIRLSIVVAFCVTSAIVSGSLHGQQRPGRRPAVETPIQAPTSVRQSLILKAHSNGIAYCVAFRPDGKQLATAGGYDNTAKVWDVSNGREVLTLKGHTSDVDCVAFSPDGKWLASSSWDNTLKLWDAANGQLKLSLIGHTERVEWLAISPDGKRIASASRDKTAKVWDATTGKEILTFNGHDDPVIAIAFSPNGKWIVSSGWDKLVKLWDSTNGHVTHTLTGHTEMVRSVVFSPDGKRVASASDDRTVKIWDAETGRKLLTLSGHTNAPFGVAFSPDGKRLASAGIDQIVKIWDATSGRDLFTLNGYGEALLTVAISPDGNSLAFGGTGGVVRLWETTNNGQAAAKRNQSSRQFPSMITLQRDQLLERVRISCPDGTPHYSTATILYLDGVLYSEIYLLLLKETLIEDEYYAMIRFMGNRKIDSLKQPNPHWQIYNVDWKNVPTENEPHDKMINNYCETYTELVATLLAKDVDGDTILNAGLEDPKVVTVTLSQFRDELKRYRERGLSAENKRAPAVVKPTVVPKDYDESAPLARGRKYYSPLELYGKVKSLVATELPQKSSKIEPKSESVNNAEPKSLRVKATAKVIYKKSRKPLPKGTKLVFFDATDVISNFIGKENVYLDIDGGFKVSLLRGHRYILSLDERKIWEGTIKQDTDFETIEIP